MCCTLSYEIGLILGLFVWFDINYYQLGMETRTQPLHEKEKGLLEALGVDLNGISVPVTEKKKN